MPSNSGQSAPARGQFHTLFKRHWTEGTGRNEDGSWTLNAFANAMAKAGVKSLDSKTTQAWLDGTHWPGRSRKDAILNTFFPTASEILRSEKGATERQTMEDAWQKGQCEPASCRFSVTGDAQLETDWVIEDPERHTDLVGIELHQPRVTNRGNYHLDASVRFASAQYPVDNVDVVVGLTEAFVAITMTGYATAQNSLINERTSLAHFRPGVNGIVVIGPRDKGILSGNPVGDEHLAVSEPRGSANQSVTVAVRAVRSNIAYAVIDDPATASPPTVQSPNRDAVLAAVLNEVIPRDAQGRYILSSARMHRNKPK